MTSWRGKHRRQTPHDNVNFILSQFEGSAGSRRHIFRFDLFLPGDTLRVANACVCLDRTCRGADESDETVFFGITQLLMYLLLPDGGNSSGGTNAKVAIFSLY